MHGIAPEPLRALQGLDWPGNVRQLENAVQSAIAAGDTALVLLEDFPSELFKTNYAPRETKNLNYYAALEAVQCEVIGTALTIANGDYKRAASIVGLHKKSMHKLIGKLNLDHLLRRPLKKTSRNSKPL